MSALTTYVHEGVTYRIGDRVICTDIVIGGGDRRGNYIGTQGVIDQFDDGETESDTETGLVRVRFDLDGIGWWMKPGTNIEMLHKPKGLVLNPKRKMTLL